MILRAKNWGEFQHYKDRSPAWIKLHRKLLDDRVFHRLPDASRALAPMIWLLCSESEDGTIKDAIAEISFRLRMTEKRVEEALNPLIEAGFFTVEQDASEPLANAEQTAPLEEKNRGEEEKEGEEKRAFDEFVEAARKNGWPTPRAMDAGRRKKLRLRLQEHGVDGWKGMLDRAGRSTFLRTKFALKFDWILEPSNFTKVIEGNYDDKGSAAVTTPTQPTADDWKGRVKWHRDKGMWNPNWGPEPGKPGCFVPREFLQ